MSNPNHPQDFGRRSYDQEILDLRTQLETVKDQNVELKEQNTGLDHKIEVLTQVVTSLTKNVAGLVEAWNTAKGVTSFVKWLSGVVVSCGVLWALFKEQLK